MKQKPLDALSSVMLHNVCSPCGSQMTQPRELEAQSSFVASANWQYYLLH